MACSFLFQKLCQKETRKFVMVMAILASVVILFWPFMLLYGNAFSSLYPAFKAAVLAKGSFTTDGSSPKSTMVNDLPYSSNFTNSTDPSTVLGDLQRTEVSKMGVQLVHGNKTLEGDMEDGFELDEEIDDHVEFDYKNIDNELSDEEVVGGSDKLALQQVISPDSTVENTRKHELSPQQHEKRDDKVPLDNVGSADLFSTAINGTNPDNDRASSQAMLPTLPAVESGVPGRMDVSASPPSMVPAPPAVESEVPGKLDVSAPSPAMLPMLLTVESGVAGRLDVSASPPSMLPTLPAVESAVPGSFGATSGESPVSIVFVTSKQPPVMLDNHEKLGSLQHGSATSSISSTISTSPSVKQTRQQITISQMNDILLQNHASHSVKPLWSSASDKELLSLKRQIENAPVVRTDQELDVLVFRNISVFKTSYALMERRLKVYIYKEGAKPIFHQPFLKGIYASEGWFMKMLEGNRKFIVNQPRKAHLFYLPFCSYILRTVLYKPELHTWKNLREFLKNYVDEIAAKYPFWNRTNGADHFFVACHDWAPKITRGNMEKSIGALCNADVSKAFKLGKDVSLPVTNVRSGDPLGDIGGKPASQRTTLAFYAGNVHGRLREILMQYWENKDPDMQIMGPIPTGVNNRKMIYIQHMKNSKYCICPKGYEVHSPRVVEAIFYECVPVIISDNYVPPFFEILNWEAFAVFVAQKDIPKLKDILISIPEERYLIMQERVRKVQQHFLWHKKPVKYDIFHMILHSIWFSRLNQVQVK